MLSVSVSGLESVPPACIKRSVDSEPVPEPWSATVPELPISRLPMVGVRVPTLIVAAPEVTSSVPARSKAAGWGVNKALAPLTRMEEPCATCNAPDKVPLWGPPDPPSRSASVAGAPLAPTSIWPVLLNCTGAVALKFSM